MISNLIIDTILQGSPIGGGGGTPYPPGEGQQNLQNWLNQGFFQNFFVKLIQNGLNDTKMEFFRCRVIRWPARPPPKLTPPRPPLEVGTLAIPAILSTSLFAKQFTWRNAKTSFMVLI